MFERFTDRARRVVVLAQEEARALSHNYIGTEHLLLGLLAEGEGVGGKALTQLGVTLPQVRDEVVRIIGRGGTNVPEGHIPFTPRAKSSLELALREALQLGHNYIGTEHILLGLIRIGEGVAAKILEQRTGGLGSVRTAVVELLKGHGLGHAAAAPVATASPSRWSPALAAAMETAVGRAGTGTVGTHHVLSVFAEWEDTAAHQVLAAGGFDPTKLETPIVDWEVADTRDETAEAWSLRVTEITMGEEGLLIHLKDPALRERVIKALSADDPVLRAAFGQAVRDLEQKLPPTG